MLQHYWWRHEPPMCFFRLALLWLAAAPACAAPTCAAPACGWAACWSPLAGNWCACWHHQVTSDADENFRDFQARRQGCAPRSGRAGRGRVRAQCVQSQSIPVIMGARSVVQYSCTWKVTGSGKLPLTNRYRQVPVQPALRPAYSGPVSNVPG